MRRRGSEMPASRVCQRLIVVALRVGERLVMVTVRVCERFIVVAPRIGECFVVVAMLRGRNLIHMLLPAGMSLLVLMVLSASHGSTMQFTAMARRRNFGKVLFMKCPRGNGMALMTIGSGDLRQSLMMPGFGDLLEMLVATRHRNLF